MDVSAKLCVQRRTKAVRLGFSLWRVWLESSLSIILETDTERGVYLDLLHQGIQRHGVELIATA
jgi:hypothetical protein